MVAESQRERRVSSVTPIATAPHRATVRVDGRSVGALSNERLGALGIATGVEWTEALELEFKHERALERGREIAARLLSRRQLSRSRLVEKLASRSVEQDIAEEVADNLSQVGLVDDEALARELIESELRRGPAGRVRLESKLQRADVDPQAAQRALSDVAGEPSEGALELAQRRLRAMPQGVSESAAKRRLYSALMRRGFDAETSAEAVEDAMRLHEQPRE